MHTQCTHKCANTTKSRPTLEHKQISHSAHVLLPEHGSPWHWRIIVCTLASTKRAVDELTQKELNLLNWIQRIKLRIKPLRGPSLLSSSTFTTFAPVSAAFPFTLFQAQIWNSRLLHARKTNICLHCGQTPTGIQIFIISGIIDLIIRSALCVFLCTKLPL